jgi:hypothetical protein
MTAGRAVACCKRDDSGDEGAIALPFDVGPEDATSGVPMAQGGLHSREVRR